MSVTDPLRVEHDAILLMLDITEKACQRLGSGEAVEPNDLRQILEFFGTFADRCHHGKEEEVLFPALEAAGIPKEGGPIGVMLREHTIGRELLRGLSEAVDQYGSGNRLASSRIIENGLNYTALLRDHIDKENNVLFKMADLQIPEDSQKEILERFESAEADRVGPGTHEAMHKLLNRLRSIYLS